jgi:flagellar biosynthesis/type III secretory pathway protein FliH
MNNNMWWGYLHQNNTIQVKRWFGDHEDYKGDCIGNPFVQQVVPPFEANSREEAIDIIKKELTMKLQKEDIEKYATEEEKKMLKESGCDIDGEDGYDAGYDAGHDAGYDVGYKKGYGKGWDEGYAQAEIDAELEYTDQEPCPHSLS